MLILCCVIGDQIRKKQVQPSSAFYKVEIRDKFAYCKLVQQFDLDQKEDITSAEYKFPLDFNSALVGLQVRTPRETIQGFLKEKVEAKKIFDEGKKEGKQVFMAREHDSDPDIVVLQLANILGDDKLTITYDYVTEVSYAGPKGVFYIPTFISPRYRGECIPRPDNKIKCIIEVNNILETVQTATPNITTRFNLADKKMIFEYTSTGIIEKDIEILFDVDIATRSHKFESKGHTFVMTHFMPAIKFEKVEREMVFILDCSGSMEGERIRNSSQAILHCMKLMQADSAEHRFTIIRYGNEPVPVSHRMIKSTNKEKMVEMIALCSNLNADLGGTETHKALQETLKFCKKALLITDGDTSDNESLHKLCSEFIVLNVLGIGSGINRQNITNMARSGHGIALFNQGGSDTTSNVETLFGGLLYPPITSVTTNLDLPASLPTHSLTSGETVSKVIKKNLQTNYPVIPNQFNTIYGMIDGNPYLGELCIKGKNSQCTIDERFPFTSLPDEMKDQLACLIAKRLIQQNPDLDKETVVELATKFNIMTQHTSFVAVSDQKVEIKEPKYSISASTVQEHEGLECCFSLQSASLSSSSFKGGSSSGIYALSAMAAQQNTALQMSHYHIDSISQKGDMVDDLSDTTSPTSPTSASWFTAPMVAVKRMYDQVSGKGVHDVYDKQEPNKGGLIDPRMGSTSIYSTSSPVAVSYDELMKNHFDESTGLFKESVKTYLQVPDEFNTPHLVTLYALSLVKSNCIDSEYRTLINLVADNYSIADFNRFSTMDKKEWSSFLRTKIAVVVTASASSSSSK